MSLACHLLLALAVWQGPVPWFHCHGTHSVLAVEAQSLRLHLQLFHPEVDPEGDEELGWHLHLRLPESGQPPLAVSRGPQPVDASRILALDQLQRDAQADAAFGTVPLAATLPRGGLLSVQAREQQLSRGGFFATFAPSLALPQRLGVYRW